MERWVGLFLTARTECKWDPDKPQAREALRRMWVEPPLEPVDQISGGLLPLNFREVSDLPPLSRLSDEELPKALQTLVDSVEKCISISFVSQ